MNRFSFSCCAAAVGLVSAFGKPPVSSDVFHFKNPRSANYRLGDEEKLRVANREKIEWLKTFPEKGSTNFVEFGSRVVVQLENPDDLKKLIAGHPLEFSRAVTKNIFILQALDALTAAHEAHRLAEISGVSASYPVMRRQVDLHGAYADQPKDYFYYTQWNLEHRNADNSSAGIDLNVRAAWPFTTGAGVSIAIVDTGVEVTHPELTRQATNSPHFNFATQVTNGTPVSGTATFAHGTEVAGVAVGSRNNLRMAGVAPNAKIASWVIFGTNAVLASDEHLMDMYQYASNVISVQNHSWGNSGVMLDGPSLLEQIGMSNAWTFGRGGKGIVMVRSCGNNRTSGANANEDGYPSDPHVIAVAAVRIDGRTATYSEPGACILVGAPSGDTAFNSTFYGLFTTDLLSFRGVNQIFYFPPFEDMNGYAFDALGFSGTSAAAPQISGIIAMMLSVNPSLTIRDVQQILILSARHFDFADPDLVPNGAGFQVSHNDGFGVPDAGHAVSLARTWTNRPAQTSISVMAASPVQIPDDGLRLIVTGAGVPPDLASIRALPGTGPHADVATPMLSLVDFAFGTNTTGYNLTNKGALIQRDSAIFATKINNAAEAGAAFAVIYNYITNSSGSGAPGGDQLTPLGGTDFTPIPAVFIGNTDGTNLVNWIQTNSAALGQIHLEQTNLIFIVTNTLLCEHVALRVQTDHQLRGDVRITLVSPSGTRSVLQRYNADVNPGPVDWTYYSTHHFFESSAGTWTAYFSDEFAGSTGSVQQATLTISGVQTTDTDHDGLDDNWEISHFGNLTRGPQEDSDGDGYSNAREQLMRTDPAIVDAPFIADLSRFNSTTARLSWPSLTNRTYEILRSTNFAGPFSLVTNVSGRLLETEFFTPRTSTNQFFRVSYTNSP